MTQETPTTEMLVIDPTANTKIQTWASKAAEFQQFFDSLAIESAADRKLAVEKMQQLSLYLVDVKAELRPVNLFKKYATQRITSPLQQAKRVGCKKLEQYDKALASQWETSNAQWVSQLDEARHTAKASDAPILYDSLPEITEGPLTTVRNEYGTFSAQHTIGFAWKDGVTEEEVIKKLPDKYQVIQVSINERMIREEVLEYKKQGMSDVAIEARFKGLLRIEDRITYHSRAKTTGAEREVHKHLSAIGAQWLYDIKRCQPIICDESPSWQTNGEVPDVIGWADGTCYVIECKTSRSDFLAEAKQQNGKKKARKEMRLGMGTYRYYLTLINIIKDGELPEDYGYLLFDDSGIKELVPAPKRDSHDIEAEGELFARVNGTPTEWSLIDEGEGDLLGDDIL